MLPPLDTPDAPIAEIAMCIWTISTRIVQAYMANPSKPGGSLAIFSWTRHRWLVGWRCPVRAKAALSE